MIRTMLAAATALTALAVTTPAVAGEVTVTLTNIRADAGDLYVSLQTEAQFMQEAAVADEYVENPQDGTLTLTFSNVPDGRYALMVWHDIDGDGTFSMGPMGPADGWSMIGASKLRGMPAFAAQSFTLDGSASITESVIYPVGGE